MSGHCLVFAFEFQNDMLPAKPQDQPTPRKSHWSSVNAYGDATGYFGVWMDGMKGCRGRQESENCSLC
jgi:hypothetical protein